nr:uncharacterized protein LOC127328316 [Lolium perenne]
MRMLEESDTCFHGILPTLPAYSLGKVYLSVVFGKPDNNSKEKIEFEVVNWESQYHVILGRPAYAKFMVVPHYAYIKLKMPDNCDRKFQRIAAKFGIKQEAVDFPPKPLALKDKENESIKKLKKKPDDPILEASAVGPSAADSKASAEDSKTPALAASTSDGIIDASKATSSLDKIEDKKNPPLV